MVSMIELLPTSFEFFLLTVTPDSRLWKTCSTDIVDSLLGNKQLSQAAARKALAAVGNLLGVGSSEQPLCSMDAIAVLAVLRIGDCCLKSGINRWRMGRILASMLIRLSL